MHLQFNDEELVQFHAVKHAFDPKGLLNPGKAVPTPKRCSEYRQLPAQGQNKPSHNRCKQA